MVCPTVFKRVWRLSIWLLSVEPFVVYNGRRLNDGPYIRTRHQTNK